MAKLTEQQVLERAYRTAAIMLRTAFTTGDVPRFKDPESLSALQLQDQANKLNDEINYLHSALEGKIKPAFEIVGRTKPEPEKKENRKNLESAIKILKGWRGTYKRRLFKAKAQQPFVEKKRAEAEKIVQRLRELKAEVEEFHCKLDEEVQKLERQLGTLGKEYERNNLNPAKPFPASLMDLNAVKRLIRK